MEESYYEEYETMEFGVNDVRGVNQHSLETFTFDKENMFETSANTVIKKLIKEKKEEGKKFEQWLSLKKEEQSKLKDEEDRYDIDIEIHTHDFYIEEYYRDEELWVIMEMKIIYLYKFFEINIKKLLKSSFPNSNTKDFFRWESLINFLKSKNINPREINGYGDIVLIKDLNNSLKHSDKIEDNIINRVSEFNNVEKISFTELNQFYERVKKVPIKFLDNLTSKIYDELYQFDNDKIEDLAYDIALRMEPKDAKTLIDKIKENYKGYL